MDEGPPRAMDAQEIRLACLRQAATDVREIERAHSRPKHAEPQHVVVRARVYADFVLGTKDADVFAKARELAETVNQ